MASAAFGSNATWQWPEETQVSPNSDNQQPRASSSDQPQSDGSTRPEPQSQDNSRPRTAANHYGPRTCRICLETVLPTYEAGVGNLASFINPTPSVSYISSDPAAGRLIRPCKCKGSSRYVHEGCLQTWRHADPDYGKRNYWECPTCSFRYRLERMTWASWINSTGMLQSIVEHHLLASLFIRNAY